MYTVLNLVLKQKCGLEFEKEYSAILEGYMYVYYMSCTVPSVVYTMHCTLAWSWSGRIFSQRCRIRYFYIMYNIVCITASGSKGHQLLAA
jgi:hypothetical protein